MIGSIITCIALFIFVSTWIFITASYEDQINELNEEINELAKKNLLLLEKRKELEQIFGTPRRK